MSTSHNFPGWPADRGPLHTLAALGLIPDPSILPGFAKYPKVWTDSNGKTVYKASPKLLDQNTLRYLAALSFEGYEVAVKPGNALGEMHLTMTVISA
jgi:hypothetical protein